MSSFFANINVRSDDQQAVAAAFRRLPKRQSAWVAPPANGWVAVFDDLSDEPDPDHLAGYTVMLSERLKTQAIGFLVHDSDVLLYTLAENAKLLDEYNSWPDYFDEELNDKEFRRLQGKPEVLARLKPGVEPAEVRAVLEEEHDFAEEKLLALARLLGLPENAAQWGYNYLKEDVTEENRPEGWDNFIHIGAAFSMAG
jgi:hypothetical protein